MDDEQGCSGYCLLFNCLMAALSDFVGLNSRTTFPPRISPSHKWRGMGADLLAHAKPLFISFGHFFLQIRYLRNCSHHSSPSTSLPSSLTLTGTSDNIMDRSLVGMPFWHKLPFFESLIGLSFISKMQLWIA